MRTSLVDVALVHGEAMNSLIVGHGGREAALATRLADSSKVFAFLGHENPTIVDLVTSGGGSFRLGDVRDGAAIAAFAVEMAIDIALVSSDEPLAAGVVDALLEAGIRTVGPTKAGSEIEWNKSFSRSLLSEVAPEANPRFAIVTTGDDIDALIAEIGNGGPVAIKPIGLTAGKGVKVVGPHLADNAAAADYVRELLASSPEAAAHIEERITAPEFTIQAITDGSTIVFPPATYDYPYRYDGDTGLGTGGMGSCIQPDGLFPFLSQEHYDEACRITTTVIHALRDKGRHFSGCVNAGFFATPDGVRVIEFNARFGDPEAINVMSLLTSDFTAALLKIASGSLEQGDITYARKASVITYLVAPSYPVASDTRYRFRVDFAEIANAGAEALFSAAIAVGNGEFETLGTSRSLAIVATGASVDEAREKVQRAIQEGVQGPLEWRSDIGVFPTAAS